MRHAPVTRGDAPASPRMIRTLQRPHTAPLAEGRTRTQERPGYACRRWSDSTSMGGMPTLERQHE